MIESYLDTVHCVASPSSYPLVTPGLRQESGTAGFPPLSEASLSYYQFQGSGRVTLTFRFHADTGSFRFNFGCHRWSPALHSLVTSTLNCAPAGIGSGGVDFHRTSASSRQRPRATEF
jgi:hypothetical protein